MAARASLQTQNYLLAASEVLRNTLLPRLDALSLFRLASTSKAMQAWVLDTPPDMWQVRTPWQPLQPAEILANNE